MMSAPIDSNPNARSAADVTLASRRAMPSEFARDPFGWCEPGTFFRRTWTVGFADVVPVVPPGQTYVHPVLVLPTEEVVSSLVGRFTPEADRLVGEWRSAWQSMTSGQVESLTSYTWARHPERRRAPVDAITIAKLRTGAHHDPGIALRGLATAARLGLRPPARALGVHEIEEAAIHLALLAAGMDVAFVLRGHGRIVCVRPTAEGRCEASRHRGRGAVIRAKALDDASTAAIPYWCSEAFLKTCRRRLFLASDAMHASAMAYDMARLGHSRAFLKACVSKGGTWVVDLSGVETVSDSNVALARAMGFDAFRFPPSESTGRILDAACNGTGIVVQEFVPFAYEHRFFVVGNRIAASTPSDRTLTPLDATVGPRRLDPRVAELRRPPSVSGEYDRGDTDNVVNRPLVAAMASLVRRLLAENERAPALGSTFVVDVGATGPDPRVDTVELIEVNSFRHSGLYAVDFGKVARALASVAGTRRRPRRPARDDCVSRDARAPARSPQDYEAF